MVPLVYGWLRLNYGLLFMQDGAPAHAAATTLEDLRERGVHPIFWPAFLPDLNLIETVWNKMKDYIAAHYLDLENGRQYTYD
jgi:transposase